MSATLAALAVLAFAMPLAGMPPPPKPLESPAGTIVWYPERYRGWETLAVIDTGGGLTVFAAEANRYQDATLEGVYVDGRLLTLRYIEVIANLAPAHSARRSGWKRWARTQEYMRLVFERTLSGGNQSVLVYESGTSAWLVVLVTVGAVE